MIWSQEGWRGVWKRIKIMEKLSKSNSFKRRHHELCICGSQVPVEHILGSFNCVITVFPWTELIWVRCRLVDASSFWHALYVMHAHVHAHGGCTECKVWSWLDCLTFNKTLLEVLQALFHSAERYKEFLATEILTSVHQGSSVAARPLRRANTGGHALTPGPAEGPSSNN